MADVWAVDAIALNLLMELDFTDWVLERLDF